MRFKDEREMWYADTERLASQLANKTEQELQDIFDEADIIELRTRERKASGVLSRLSLIIIWPLLLSIFCFKWMLTGDGHLDSWAKKYKVISYFYDIVNQE